MPVQYTKSLSLGFQLIQMAMDKEDPYQKGFKDSFKRYTGLGKNTVKCKKCHTICCKYCMGNEVQ